MQFRKSIFAVLALAASAGGSYFAEKAGQNAALGTQVVADGGDPVPLPYPKPRGLAISDQVNGLADGLSVQVADGGDPVPLPYPRPKRGGVSAHANLLPENIGVLVADGGDPVPLPYPHRLA